MSQNLGQYWARLQWALAGCWWTEEEEVGGWVGRACKSPVNIKRLGYMLSGSTGLSYREALKGCRPQNALNVYRINQKQLWLHFSVLSWYWYCLCMVRRHRLTNSRFRKKDQRRMALLGFKVTELLLFFHITTTNLSVFYWLLVILCNGPKQQSYIKWWFQSTWLQNLLISSCIQSPSLWYHVIKSSVHNCLLQSTIQSR